MSAMTITLVGGPTALIEIGGFRLLTDPTFDAPGEYRLPHVTFRKTSRPALTAEQIGAVDAVLPSHDQHADNLDNAGRAFLARAGRVLTTVAGAERLQAPAEGLSPWDETELTAPCRGLGAFHAGSGRSRQILRRIRARAAPAPAGAGRSDDD